MGLDHFLCFLRREVRISHLFLLIMLSFCCNALPKQAMFAKITKFELVQYLIIRWIKEKNYPKDFILNPTFFLAVYSSNKGERMVVIT